MHTNAAPLLSLLAKALLTKIHSVPSPASALSWASSCIQNWADPQSHLAALSQRPASSKTASPEAFVRLAGRGIAFKNIGDP